MTKEITRHGKMGNTVFTFDVPGETIIALHNAISFTLARADDYIQNADSCETCLEAMQQFRQYLEKVIDNAPLYMNFKKKSN